MGSRVVVLDLPEEQDHGATVLRVFSQHRIFSESLGRSFAGRRKPTLVNDRQQSALGEKEAGESKSEDESGNNSTSSNDSSSEEEDDDDDFGNQEDDTSHFSSIACMSSSTDGQWLVTADLARRMHVFNLDNLRYHSTLPSLELPPVALAFSSLSTSILVAALPNNTIQFFNVDSRSIPAWGPKISLAPSGALSTQREPVLGLAFDPLANEVDNLLIYGSTWLLKMKVPTSTSIIKSESRKRKMDDDHDESHTALPVTSISKAGTSTDVTHKYQPIAMVDFTADGELVVVERPFFSMLGQMAPAFFENRYGS